MLTNLSQERGVLAGPTANLEDGVTTQIGQRFTGDDLVQIARQVSILIVCRRPICVGLLRCPSFFSS